MTETERIELLKAVAECAPKEMGARFIGPEMLDSCRVEFCGSWLDLDGDKRDGNACFAMLDAMEKAQPEAVIKLLKVDAINPYSLHVEVGVSDEEYDSIRQFSDAPRPLLIDIMGIGATRAEAIARAFVEVFAKS